MTACPFQTALKPEHRADPYPFYAEISRTPVQMEDGRYVVTAYEDVVALLHDARLSSATADDAEPPTPAAAGGAAPAKREHSLLRLDPPDHDRVRRIMMRQFGPPHCSHLVSDLEGEITRQANALLDRFEGSLEMDVVERFAHPLPLAIIRKLLDIPASDEGRFREWIDTITGSTGTDKRRSEDAMNAMKKLGGYLTEMADSRRDKPGTDMLSGLVNDDGPEGRLPRGAVGATATLLLIAGHETTVNLIANGVLTLLRHPQEIERLRGDPARAALVVEELLRVEPPVQFLGSRKVLADIEVGGVVIPAGSTTVLVLAAANRDPARFADPDRFDPDRGGIQHLGFGSGIHTCFGAPLARLESQIALRLFFERLQNPRLVAEPPYRVSPLLRGPSRMQIAYDRVHPSARPAGDSLDRLHIS